MHGRRRAENGKHIPDSKLNFRDIPELTDEELARARPVGRPKNPFAKQIIAIRLDPRLIEKLRKLAVKEKLPYQTLIHEMLEHAVGKKNRAA